MSWSRAWASFRPCDVFRTRLVESTRIDQAILNGGGGSQSIRVLCVDLSIGGVSRCWNCRSESTPESLGRMTSEACGGSAIFCGDRGKDALFSIFFRAIGDLTCTTSTVQHLFRFARSLWNLSVRGWRNRSAPHCVHDWICTLMSYPPAGDSGVGSALW